MPTVNIEQKHALSAEDAVRKAEVFVKRVQEDQGLGKYIHLVWRWDKPGQEMTLSFTGRVSFDGVLKLDPGLVRLTLKLPLVALPFKQRITDQVSTGLARLFGAA